MAKNERNKMGMIRGLNYKLLLVAIVISSLAACVTTEKGGVGTKADDGKALEYSVQLARSYIRSGNWEAAKRHLKTAIEIDENSADVYEALALVYQNTGETDRSEENYRKAIKLQPKISRVRNNYAAFLYSEQRYGEAIEQLEMVVADVLYEKRPNAYVNLGRAYIQLEKLESAEKAFRRAYLMNKRDASLIYQMADIYYMLGDYPKSQQFYDAFRTKVKKQPAQALWLGIRLADKFDNRNAMSSYALALRNLYPTSKEYLEYKEAFGTAN